MLFASRKFRGSLLLGFSCAFWVLPGEAEALQQAQILRGKQATAYVEVRIGKRAMSGTAFCIDADGFFITNHHVVAGARAGTHVDEVGLVLNPGGADQRVLGAKVVMSRPDLDLALLRADPVGAPFKAFSLGLADDVSETDEITAFGYPFGAMMRSSKDVFPAITVTVGRISALRRAEGNHTVLQVDVSLNPGNSGGPVLNQAGRVIGIVWAGVRGTQSINFVLPISYLATFLSEPVLYFNPPVISWKDRYKPVDFRVRILSLEPIPDPLHLEMRLENGSNQPRTFSMIPEARNVFRAQARPLMPPDEGGTDEPISFRCGFVARSDETVLVRDEVVVLLGASQVEKTVEASIPRSDTVAKTDGRVSRPNERGSPETQPRETEAGEKRPAHQVLRLPATLDQVRVGGGGRYLFLRLPRLRNVAVFDAKKGNLVRYLPIPSRAFELAAGSRHLFVGLPRENEVVRYNLETFQKELTAPIPLNGADLRMAMGSSATGPLLLLNSLGVMFLDAETLRKIPIRMEGKFGVCSWGRDSCNSEIRAAPGGLTMVGWNKSRRPPEVFVTTLDGDTAVTISNRTIGSEIWPAPDGLGLFGSSGLYTVELKQDPLPELRDKSLLPDREGIYFLEMLSLLGIPSPDVYAMSDRSRLFSLGPLAELESPKVDRLNPTRDPLALGHRVHFLPSLRTLVTIPYSDDRLVVRTIDVEGEIEKAESDYLFAASAPVREALRGSAYTYQVRAKARHGGVEYVLASGPEGMTISKEGLLRWDVPASHELSVVSVVVILSDSTERQVFHSFSLSVR